MEQYREADILKIISVIYRKMQIYINVQTRNMGLSSGLTPFIMLTCENGEMTQNKFCELLDISKGTVAKTLARLEEQGYVVRVENAEDGRFINVHPTEKAKDIYPQLVHTGDAWVKKMMQGMEEEERMQFLRSLGKIAKNVSDYM